MNYLYIENKKILFITLSQYYISMPTQKSIDYKETAVNYYLVEDKTQEEVCQILFVYIS